MTSTTSPRADSPRLLTRSNLHPRYWGWWLILGLAWLITRCPHAVRMKTGTLIGALGYRFSTSRRHIVDVNLALCFPDLSDDERSILVRSVFQSVGKSLIETALAWSQPLSRYDHLFEFHGTELLKAELARGHGVILLGMHMATLDISGAGLSQHVTFDVMYRKNKNRLMEAFMTRGRRRLYPSAIERSDVRTVIRNLKAGHVVWYGPDQDYGRKHSVFAPFFNIPAASIVATSRIARISKSPIVVFYQYRKPDDSGYEIHFEPMPEQYPDEDEVVNATVVNEIIEKVVSRHPEQYWWLHRRFKTRPEGVKRPY